MSKNQRSFILEISLNVLFLSLGLFIAFYLLLSANKSHQENLALSKMQAQMMVLSEELRGNTEITQDIFYYDALGELSNSKDKYSLTLSQNYQDNLVIVTLKLTNNQNVVLASWDVGVSP